MTDPAPLAGIRVIDFTHMRAGPQCTMMLVDDLEQRLGARTREEWLERLVALDVPCGPVHRMDEVFADPQVQAEALALSPEQTHPTVGQVPMPGFPVILERSPPRAVLPPPLLGQHTEEVLAELAAPREKSGA